MPSDDKKDVVDAEVTSVAIVKADGENAPVKPEVWTWDKKKRIAFRMALEGVGPSEIAKKVGVHRNTIRNWSRTRQWGEELRTRLQEQQLSTKIKRLNTLDKVGNALTEKALDVIENPAGAGPALTAIFLKETREYAKLERELYGENGSPSSGGSSPNLININVGGGSAAPAATDQARELEALSFRDYLKAHTAESDTIEATDEQTALVTKTRELLQQTDLLDQVHEVDKQASREEAAKEEATKKRR